MYSDFYHHNFGKLMGLAALHTAWIPASRWCYSLQLYLIQQDYFDLCHPGWIFCYVCPRTHQDAQKWLILCVCRGRGERRGRGEVKLGCFSKCLLPVHLHKVRCSTSFLRSTPVYASQHLWPLKSLVSSEMSNVIVPWRSWKSQRGPAVWYRIFI